MHRKKTSDPQDNEDLVELKSNPRKRLKKVPDEGSKVNLITSSVHSNKFFFNSQDDEDSTSKSKMKNLIEKPETKTTKSNDNMSDDIKISRAKQVGA